MRRFGFAVLAFGLSLAGSVVLPVYALDADHAREIYGPCAGCHGEFGAGGKKGEYPRIAGQPKRFIVEQLKLFQRRVRINIPMVPYTEERELSDDDMEKIAAWLSQIELPTRLPEFKDSDDALTRLLAVEKVMIVPRTEGDIDRGQRVYEKSCQVCHGKSGRGVGEIPLIVGQYTNYLKKQIDAYVRGERPHDEDVLSEGVLNSLSARDIQDVLAYLTAIQERR